MPEHVKEGKEGGREGGREGGVWEGKRYACGLSI